MKNISKIIVLLMFIGLSLPFVSSEINNYAPVKQGNCFIAKQVCPSCSYLNISISYPNSTYAQYEVVMDRTGAGDWFYEFCNTSQLGRYDVTGHGDLSGTDTGFDVLYFEVTPSGSVLDSASSTTLFGSLLVMLILSVIFIIMAMKTESLAGKLTLYCISGIGFIMVILYTVVTIQQVLFGFDSIVTGIETLWVVAKIGITIGGVALGIVVMLIMLKAWKIKRGFDD